MIKKTIAIELETGLEARPVAMLVQVASQYDSNIYVECGTSQCEEYYGYDDPWTGSRRTGNRYRRWR